MTEHCGDFKPGEIAGVYITSGSLFDDEGKLKPAVLKEAKYFPIDHVDEEKVLSKSHTIDFKIEFTKEDEQRMAEFHKMINKAHLWSLDNWCHDCQCHIRQCVLFNK